VRRFVILAAAFVFVTIAVRFGPAIYPWTPASERASRHESFGSDADLDELSPIRRAYQEATNLYRQGRFEEAEQRFRAVAHSSSELLQARSAYHRGNCLLGQARRQGPTLDPDLLHKAEEQYRDCLDRLSQRAGAESLLDNARFNLEMTRLLLAQSERRPGSAVSLAKGPGQSARSSAAAKTAATAGAHALVRANGIETPRPAPAGTEAPVQPDRSAAELAKVAEAVAKPITTNDQPGVMVGPDGVIYRKVEAAPPTSK
jgi:hypothetical protein